ncbi:MAG: hypothetical protein AB7S26_09130 [Sandaracinaceae bacterium]
MTTNDPPRSSIRRAALTAGLTAAIACAQLGAPSSHARAVELYEDPPPPRAIIVYPSRPPTTTVYIAPTPAPVVVQPPPPARRDDELRLVLGGGIGPMFVLSAPSLSVVPVGHAHVGLAVGDVEFGVRVGLAPYAATIENEDGSSHDAGLYTTDATFTLRLFQEAIVHPVIGAGVGAVIESRSDGAAAGFGLSARAGLELGVPFEDGDLAAGLDAIATQVVGAESGFSWALATSVTVGAHLDYRF